MLNRDTKVALSVVFSFLPGPLYAWLPSRVELVLRYGEPKRVGTTSTQSSATCERLEGYIFICVLLVMFYLAHLGSASAAQVSRQTPQK